MKDELKEIRNELMIGVENNDILYIKMMINKIDTLLYNIKDDCHNCVDGKCRVYNSGESTCIGILTANCKYHNK